MSTSPREIGTLIAVLLKARNLPNKRHIGKQDPYCVVEFDGRRHNTKVIKRGGQHPEWDEEIRFTLYELEASDSAPDTKSGRAPPPPPKKTKGVPNVQGGTFLKISCYAQDVKEPDFIGDTHVDLTEVLTTGETDEWFTLTNKGRYCGEVYLELTFWSNEPPPVKKAPVKSKAKKQYGGPGSFTALPDARGSSESLGGSPSRWSPSGVRAMTSTSSNTWRHSFTEADIRPEALPRSLRSSSSIAQIGLYRPSYESTETHNSAHSSRSTQQSTSSVASLTDELGQMNLRRRLSLPQITHTEMVRGTASSSSSANWSQPGSVGYNHSVYSSHSDDASTQHHDDSTDSRVGPAYPVQHRTGGPELYQPPYEPISRASSVYSMQPQSQPSRGPRHSLPSSSSGFIPLPTSASSSFPVPTPAPQMHTYQAPSVSATPAPMYGRASVPPPSTTPAAPPTMYAPPAGPPPGAQSFRPPTTAPAHASYPPANPPVPAPPSPFSSISQQLTGSANPLPPAASYHSIPQSQSSYSYGSYPTSSSISSNSSHQYPQQSTPPSALSASPSMRYSPAFQQIPPPSFQQQQNTPRPPPPPTPVGAPPTQVVGYNQPQSHALPHVPPPPPLGQMQAYSAPPDRTSQMSTAPSHISVNIPPPPPLNPSPSQIHTARPLPEVPQNGPSPVKRSGAMSIALSHAVGSVQPQPSVVYPSYNQIPPPPPLTSSSNMSVGQHSPPIPAPPPIPESRRLPQHPQPQPVPPPPPSHHQPPKRTPSAQALYHSAVARQQAAHSSAALPPPPPPMGGQQQQYQQSAYHALQQRAVSTSYAPQPPPMTVNHQPGYPVQPPVNHPGALPMPPRLPPSQSHQQYPVTNGWQ